MNIYSSIYIFILNNPKIVFRSLQVVYWTLKCQFWTNRNDSEIMPTTTTCVLFVTIYIYLLFLCFYYHNATIQLHCKSLLINKAKNWLNMYKEFISVDIKERKRNKNMFLSLHNGHTYVSRFHIICMVVISWINIRWRNGKIWKFIDIFII